VQPAAVNFRMVRLAREIRGWSQTVLARESGVAQAVISRIESGLRQPHEGDLRVLGRALGFPAEFFFEPDTPSAAPLFRKRSIRSVRTNQLIQARINIAVLVARRIIDAGITIETPFVFPEPGGLTREPTAATHELRRAWQLPNGRVDSVTRVIENAGGVVLHVDFGTDDASAAFVSSLADSRLWFLLNTRERAGDRARLSLAHELGHAAMHRLLPVYDEGRLEPEAYEFAAALLLPSPEFDRQIRGGQLTLSQARDLKRHYGVSIQAIVRAARDRGLIGGERYTSLYKQISARGWRLDEPDPVKVESAEIWPAALRTHRERHGYTDEDLALIARVSTDTLYELFPTTLAPRLRPVGPADPGTRGYQRSTQSQGPSGTLHLLS
jgi:Zn-dependent peptidase ImmA (M78 family)/transcriptional regulator with XRE-family HTH domain